MVKIHNIHRSSDAIGAVIFVHGITGEYQETWKSAESEDDPFWPNWLKDDYPYLSVFGLNYQSKITNWNDVETPHLIELAEQAHDSLRREKEIHGKPLLFICHSMGGLVVKFMLRAAETSSDQDTLCLTDHTKGVVFIAVPHAGARKASLAAKLGFLSRPSEATKNMAWDDPYLRDLKRWYNSRSQSLDIGTWAFAAAEDEIVEPLSADPGVDGVALKSVPGDHSSVCKLRSRKAELYRDVFDILTQFRQNIAQASQTRRDKERQGIAAVGMSEAAAPFVVDAHEELPAAPAGWTWVNQNWLDQYRKPLGDDDLIKFFDGRMPSWRLALSERVPRRAIVTEAVNLLRTGASEPGRPTVAFLQGAGGEGKSTAFHQTIIQLLENDPDWHVLWRDNDQQPLPTDWISRLPDDGKPVLIATDEADNIGRSLLTFVEMIRRADDDRFHFLLAARDTDWRGSKPDDAKWRELSKLQVLPLRGIQDGDAEKIYNAWSSAGERGLGRLGGMSRDNAIRRLVTKSKDKEVDRAEGAFLGAMIELRFGEDFKGHVQKLLDRLKARSGRLHDAYAYVAAMHAENLLFLSSPVLAKELGITEKELRREVVWPLADEACGAVQGGFILTRHRTIAEAAIEIMEEQGEDDRWSLITDLAEQAVRIGFAGVHVPQTASWRFKIADLLAEQGDYAKASGLIETFLTIEPNDTYLLVKLAQLYRRSGDAAKAERLYRDNVDRIIADPSRSNARRGFFYEWSAAAGNAGGYALNIWLAGVSLSDWQDLPRLDAEQVKLSLAGLGAACREVLADGNDQVLQKARGAVAQLGLRLQVLDQMAKTYFERYRDDAKADGVGDMSVEQAVRAIEAAVQWAFDQCGDADELIDLGVPYPPDEFGFSSLRDFMLAEQRRARR